MTATDSLGVKQPLPESGNMPKLIAGVIRGKYPRNVKKTVFSQYEEKLFFSGNKYGISEIRLLLKDGALSQIEIAASEFSVSIDVLDIVIK